MRRQDICPSCEATEHQVIHDMIIQDVYEAPEGELEKTNNYHRNHILFRRILPPNTHFLRVRFKLCKRCGLIFFTPRPDDADLSIKYGEIIRTRETEQREKAFALVDLRRRRAHEIYERLRPFLEEPIENALDIGGADGHCLASFADNAVCAILDYEKRDMWPGVERIGSTLADLSEGHEFGLVLCCHTLEHVDLLNEFLCNIRKHITSRGLLYIEVPVGCNGEIYRTRNILTHLNFFSRSSLGALLERNGYEVEYCEAIPALSRKRYLPVVAAIARKTKGGASPRTTADKIYEQARKEMRQHAVDYRVVLSNVLLVLSQPASYARAFLRM